MNFNFLSLFIYHWKGDFSGVQSRRDRLPKPVVGDPDNGKTQIKVSKCLKYHEVSLKEGTKKTSDRQKKKKVCGKKKKKKP